MKKLLLRVLEEALGCYFVLEDSAMLRKQLQVSALKGEVVLQDLVVRSAAIDRLGLPLHTRGTLKALHIHIPWNKLVDFFKLAVVASLTLLSSGKRARANEHEWALCVD